MVHSRIAGHHAELAVQADHSFRPNPMERGRLDRPPRGQNRAGGSHRNAPSFADFVLRRTDDRDHPASFQLDLTEVIPRRSGHRLFPSDETDPYGIELLLQLVGLLDLQAEAREGVEQFLVRALRLEIFKEPRWC